MNVCKKKGCEKVSKPYPPLSLPFDSYKIKKKAQVDIGMI